MNRQAGGLFLELFIVVAVHPVLQKESGLYADRVAKSESFKRRCGFSRGVTVRINIGAKMVISLEK